MMVSLFENDIKWSDNLWFICGFISIIIGFIAYLLPSAQGIDSSGLLISISGSLATIFALLVTITLLLAQILKRGYKTMDKLINNKIFIFVYFFFLIGVVYPLLVLKTDINILKWLDVENSTVANLSVAISIACIAFGILVLLPYSKEIFKIGKYDAVQKLLSDAKDAIAANRRGETEDTIKELSELGKDFIENNYEYDVSFIIHGLSDNGIKVIEKEWVRAATSALDGLEKIGLKAIEKELDGLKSEDFGIVPGNERLCSETLEVFQGITEIGMKATDKKLMGDHSEIPVAFHAITALKKMGIEAINNNLSLSTVSNSPWGLLRIGIGATEKELGLFGDPLGFVKEIKNRLIDISIHANKKDEFQDIAKESMKYLWILSAYIKKGFPSNTSYWIDCIKADLRAKSSDRLFETAYPDAEKLINHIKQYPRGFPSIENELNEIKQLWDSNPRTPIQNAAKDNA